MANDILLNKLENNALRERMSFISRNKALIKSLFLNPLIDVGVINLKKLHKKIKYFLFSFKINQYLRSLL